MTSAILPASLHDAARIATHHLRAAARLRGRYNAEKAVEGHVDAALATLEKALRAEDDTAEVALKDDRPDR